MFSLKPLTVDAAILVVHTPCMYLSSLSLRAAFPLSFDPVLPCKLHCVHDPMSVPCVKVFNGRNGGFRVDTCHYHHQLELHLDHDDRCTRGLSSRT